MSLDFEGNCRECGNKVHRELTHCRICEERERNNKKDTQQIISELREELRDKKRIIRIYEAGFEEIGKRVPEEQCDRCGKLLYCDFDVYGSDDNTQILCEVCMGVEVSNRKECDVN